MLYVLIVTNGLNRCEQSALEELDTSCLKYDNLTELKLYIAFNYYDL
jgi:hypothetical protein